MDSQNRPPLGHRRELVSRQRAGLGPHRGRLPGPRRPAAGPGRAAGPHQPPRRLRLLGPDGRLCLPPTGRPGVDTVVLLGPSHRAWVGDYAVSAEDAYETPLGRVPLDRRLHRRPGSPPPAPACAPRRRALAGDPVAVSPTPAGRLPPGADHDERRRARRRPRAGRRPGRDHPPASRRRAAASSSSPALTCTTSKTMTRWSAATRPWSTPSPPTTWSAHHAADGPPLVRSAAGCRS